MSVLEAVTELELLALTVLGEARGEPLTGLVAVAQVVRNRLRVPARFGATWRAVILAPKQFSCWNADDPNRAWLERIATRAMNGASLGAAAQSFGEAKWVAGGVMLGAVRDVVPHATHYHTKSVHPKWAKHMTPSQTIGSHLFYEGIA